MALFVALTRAVREAPVPAGVRNRAYDIVDRLAQTHGRPSFAGELEALRACATQDPRFFAALQPFWNELRSLSTASLSRAKGETAD